MGKNNSKIHVAKNGEPNKHGLKRSLSCVSKKSRNAKTTTRIPVHEYEALQHLKGPELSTLVRSARTDGSFVSVTTMSTADLMQIEELMSQLRKEVMRLNQVEMDRIVKMGISINAMDEDVKAFIKPLPDEETVFIYGFDYSNLNRAQHYIKVRIKRLRTTPEVRKKTYPKKTSSVENHVNKSSEKKKHKDDKGVNSNNYAQTSHTNTPENGQELLHQKYELNELEDTLEYEALTHLMGHEFTSAFRTIKNNPSKKSSLEHKYVVDLLDSLKREDVVFSPGEMNTLRNVLNVKTEGVNAFIKALDNVDKIAICAFDYTSMNRAKHLLNVKCGRVKVTSGRTAKRYEDSGITEQFRRYSSQSHSLVTRNGIQVSVYKADITQLTVDAIVNAANEQLFHGGGVANAIARAAGHKLEIEGDEYIKAHGRLKVTDVVPTSSGNLPCKKVLHAVGPCWTNYQDKNMCQERLAQTVFNCFLKAHESRIVSLATCSISSAIFKVPKHICATMYLAAIQRFDYEYGPITTLQHIHFVDISDDMVAIIQDTFTEKWETTVKPPKSERPRTDTYGSEWDWDERAPCSLLEMKEKGTRHHSFPYRVRHDNSNETRGRVHEVEEINKKYFQQQSGTRQFHDASLLEKGTTKYRSDYPDHNPSAQMLPGEHLKNYPSGETDHACGPNTSKNGQTRDLEDRIGYFSSSSAYELRDVVNRVEQYNAANLQSSSYQHTGNRQNNSSTNDDYDINRQYNSSSNTGHGRDRQYNASTNDGRGRDRQYNSSTNDRRGRDRQYNSSTTDGHSRNSQYNSSTTDGHGRDRQYNSSTNDGHGRDRQYNSSTNDGHGRDRQYNSSTYDGHGRDRQYNSSTYDGHGRDRQYNSSTNDGHGRDRQYNSSTNDGHDKRQYNPISIQPSIESQI